MARISPFFKSAIKRGKIELAPNQGAIEALHRRQLVEWCIYTFVDGKRTAQYTTIKATVERLNHRIGMGLALDSADMAEVARPQTDHGKAVVEAWLKRRTAEAAKKQTTQTTLKQALSKPVQTTAQTQGQQAQTAAQAQPVQIAQKPTTLPKPPKPPTKPKKAAAKTAAKKTKVKSATQAKAAPATPVAPKKATALAAPVEEPHIILVFDESGSMAMRNYELTQQSNAIVKRLATDLPKASVEICRFHHAVRWATAIQAERIGALSHDTTGSATFLNTALYQAANKAELMSQKRPVLVYLLTDGEATDRAVTGTASAAVAAALKTNKVTFACVGPKTAASFFKSCGIPDACVREWSGNDSTDLSVVTQQATQGISSFAAATKQGKTSLDSFFVDVVKTGATVERAKRELTDVTKTLRRVKVSKYITIEDFARDVLKVNLVPGAAYYQLVKAETLRQDRKIILQPRDKSGALEQIFLTGPSVRPLLGLPSDRDCKIEPKNLGDFVVYLQSASPTRKLTPGSLCLYDEAHVFGATDPTFTYGKKA